MATKKESPSRIADNKKAAYNYFFEEKFEAGVVLQGWEVKAAREGKAQLTDGFSSPDGRRQFVRGAFDVTSEGAQVSPVGGHGSHLIGSLSQSNALIVVPETTTSVDAGAIVDVLVLDRNF